MVVQFGFIRSQISFGAFLVSQETLEFQIEIELPVYLNIFGFISSFHIQTYYFGEEILQINLEEKSTLEAMITEEQLLWFYSLPMRKSSHFIGRFF